MTGLVKSHRLKRGFSIPWTFQIRISMDYGLRGACVCADGSRLLDEHAVLMVRNY
jgi:hypothetical protein